MSRRLVPIINDPQFDKAKRVSSFLPVLDFHLRPSLQISMPIVKEIIIRKHLLYPFNILKIITKTTTTTTKRTTKTKQKKPKPEKAWDECLSTRNRRNIMDQINSSKIVTDDLFITLEFFLSALPIWQTSVCDG